MKKKSMIGKVKASKLFKKYQDMNLPGANILIYSSKVHLYEQIDTACIVCHLEDVKNIKLAQLNHYTRGICLKIEEKYLGSFQQFEQYYKDTLLSLINESQQSKQSLKCLFLDCQQNTNSQEFLSIMKYLQVKELCLIIQPQIHANNWKDYQQQLANVSNKILQHQYLVLSTVSLVLSLPKIQCEDYSKKLVAIWRRTIPTEIGRIVIEEQCQKQSKFDIQQIKHSQICWLIQFICSNPQNLTKLSEKALGLQ